MIHAKSLYAVVFPLVADRLLLATNLAEIIEKRAKLQANPRAVIYSEISRAARELETIADRLAGLYENYADRLVSEQEYVKIKADYESGSGFQTHLKPS